MSGRSGRRSYLLSPAGREDNTRIIALRNDVGEAIVDDEFHGYLGVVRKQLAQDGRCLLQRGLYCRARADLLEIAADDVLALGDTFQHCDEAAIGGAERNKALLGLVALANNVDVLPS
jgi:hypothetical protein